MRLLVTCSSTKVCKLADLECSVKYNTALPHHITDPLHKPSALSGTSRVGGRESFTGGPEKKTL